MKRILLSLLVVAGFATAASAQTFKAGDDVIGLNFGFKGFENNSYGVSYEIGVLDHLFGTNIFSLGIGINGLYYGFEQEATIAGVKYTYEHGNYVYTGRVALHASLIEGLDLYIGGNIGGSTLTKREKLVGSGLKVDSKTESEPEFVYGGVLGARYFFLDTFGIGVEGSVGNSQGLVQASLLFKF